MEHSSVARDLLHDLFRGLGAETIGLQRSDSFVAIDTEAVRELLVEPYFIPSGTAVFEQLQFFQETRRLRPRVRSCSTT